MSNCILNDDSSGSDDDYMEEPYVDTSLDGLCLFCSHSESDCDKLLIHLKNEHSIDLRKLACDNQLDSILYIKLINFIRSSGTDPGQIGDIIGKDVWKKDDFMKPVKENDLLLTLDIEDDWDDTEDEKLTPSQVKCDQQSNQSLLQDEIRKIQSLITDITNMDDKVLHNDLDNDSYFFSYAHHTIHWEMLSDRPRTETYRKAILETGKFLGNSCLDIGCGTGILSLFAFKAGASKIVAVDQSDIIYSAMDIAQENGVHDAITFKKGKLEDLELNEKFDIIVSEWMGYFLLFEGMLDTVITARDKYLKPGGLMMPRSCSIFMAALSNEKLYNERITFWNDVYGFKMTSMKKDVLNEVLIREINSSSLVSNQFEVKKFNLSTCTIKEAQQVESIFSLKINTSGIIHGLVFWFDCYFDESNDIILSTSPNSPITHWKQSIIFFKEPINFNEGETLSGKIELSRSCDDFRSLKIQLTIEGKGIQRYIMN